MSLTKNSNPVLLLNSTYEPIRVINWQRAITLYYLDKVEIIDKYEVKIHTVSLSIPCPSVVRLKYYVHNTRIEPKPSRTLILKRDEYRCQYCGNKVNNSVATIDHIIPKSRGGKLSLHNVVCSCSKCNCKKGNKTPDEAKMRLISNPNRKLDWFKLFYLLNNKEILENWKPYLFNIT